jgi:hypothetical protein
MALQLINLWLSGGKGMATSDIPVQTKRASGQASGNRNRDCRFTVRLVAESLSVGGSYPLSSNEEGLFLEEN